MVLKQNNLTYLAASVFFIADNDNETKNRKKHSETKQWKYYGIVNLNIQFSTQSYSGRESTDFISMDETSL